jgi:putative DNA primase/helicase
MRFKGVDFKSAAELIEEHIGSAKVTAPAKPTKSETQRESDRREQMAALWTRAKPLTGEDLASRYLMARNIRPVSWPSSLRLIDDLPYWEGEKTRTLYSALLAKFASPDGKSATLHRTYLVEPGRKAPIEKPRMLMPGRIPAGGAVRLMPATETMGIAEGIETALSASQLFGLPVWAALSAGALVKWTPPKEAKCILIFGDNDESFAGQNAAYSLAYRLKTEGFQAEVRMPSSLGSDWNDELLAESAAA